jgi:hypothetical protein
MLNYYCGDENPVADGNCWKNAGYYLTLLLVLQITFFLVLWVILFMRHKYFEKYASKPVTLL